MTPEAERLVMEKVQDINAEGTAFSNVFAGEGNLDFTDRRVEMMQVLKEGLLGTPHGSQGGWDERSRTAESIKSSWAKNARKTKKGTVHFNIVGRIRGKDKGEFKMHKSQYVGDDGGEGLNRYPRNNMAVIIDISNYKELPYSEPDKTEHNRTFKPNDHDVFKQIKPNNPDYARYRGYVDDQDKMIPTEEYGFVASFRVPPRNFKGIVFNAATRLTQAEINREPSEFYRSILRLNPYHGHANAIVRQKRVIEIRDMMFETYKEQPELLMPIYDIQGNLCWPIQMSYEGVKKFVAERDAKKPEGSK